MPYRRVVRPARWCNAHRLARFHLWIFCSAFRYIRTMRAIHGWWSVKRWASQLVRKRATALEYGGTIATVVPAEIDRIAAYSNLLVGKTESDRRLLCEKQRTTRCTCVICVYISELVVYDITIPLADYRIPSICPVSVCHLSNKLDELSVLAKQYNPDMHNRIMTELWYPWYSW